MDQPSSTHEHLDPEHITAGAVAPAVTHPEIAHIFQAWDEALGAKDLDAAMALYHPEITLESPLVRHLLHSDNGVVRGREALRDFVKLVFAHQPPERRRFRNGYLTDGAVVTWEYPRESPAGDQMDIVEVMEVRDGLIRHHRIYWGWLVVSMLDTDAHPG